MGGGEGRGGGQSEHAQRKERILSRMILKIPEVPSLVSSLILLTTFVRPSPLNIYYIPVTNISAMESIVNIRFPFHEVIVGYLQDVSITNVNHFYLRNGFSCSFL